MGEQKEFSKNTLKWLGDKIEMDPKQSIFENYLELWRGDSELALYKALKLNSKGAKDIGILMESYIALAEFEFLNGEDTLRKSQTFWDQGKQTLFQTYHDSDDWIFL